MNRAKSGMVMPMDRKSIGVCSWSLQPNCPDSLVDLLGETGVESLQLALSPIVEQPGVWGGAVEKLRKAGIEIISGMMAMKDEDYSTLESIARTGGVRPDETWEANLTHAKEVAQLASEVGIDLVTFHAGFLPEHAADPEREKLIARLNDLAFLFDPYGIDIALETGQETATTLSEVLADINQPNLGVNFDPANMILYGKGDPVEALKKLARQVMQIHIKDALPSECPGEWGTEMPMGQGAVNWPGFFKIAREKVPPVNFIIEREAGANRIGDIRAAYELITLQQGEKVVRRIGGETLP